MEKINFDFDIPQLAAEVAILLNRVPLGMSNQVALMHINNCNDPYYFGCGHLYYEGDIGKQTMKKVINQEEEFINFNKELEDTYFYSIYKEISEHFKLARMRIIALEQKTCLTWHVDLEKRIHVPIITDEKCRFVVEDTSFHLPADGNAYIVDTTKHHTVFNGSRIVRIHLIASIINYI